MIVTCRHFPANFTTRKCFGYLTSNLSYLAMSSCYTMETKLVKNSGYNYFSCITNSSLKYTPSGNGSYEYIPSLIEFGGNDSKFCSKIVLQCFEIEKPFEVLLLDKKFAEKCGIHDGNWIVLEPVSQIFCAESIEIELESLSDWKIIESSAVVIEDIFLEQVNILIPEMKLILYLGDGLPINFCVNSCKPDIAFNNQSYAMLLSNKTTVFVAPFIDAFTINKDTLNCNNISDLIDNIFYNKRANVLNINHYLTPAIKHKSERYLRILPKTKGWKLSMPNIVNKLNIIVTLSTDNSYTKAFIAEVGIFPNFVKLAENNRTSAVLIELGAKNSIYDQIVPHGLYEKLKKFKKSSTDPQFCWVSFPIWNWVHHVLKNRAHQSIDLNDFVDYTLLEIFPLNEECLVEVNTISVNAHVQNSIKKLSGTQIYNTLKNFFRNCVSSGLLFPVLIKNCDTQHWLTKTKDNVSNALEEGLKIILSFNQLHENAVDIIFILKPAYNFGSNRVNTTIKYFYFWPNSNVAFQIENVQNFEAPAINPFKLPHQAIKLPESVLIKKEFGFQKILIDKIKIVLMANILNRCIPCLNHILLSGTEASGKTTVFQFLSCQMMSEMPYVYSHIIDCHKWRSLMAEEICRIIKSLFYILVSKQPAILFLDNFDFLQSFEDNENQNRHFQMIFLRIFEEIQSYFSSKKHLPIIVICSVRNEKNILPAINEFEDCRFFSNYFHIQELDKKEQIEILAYLLKRKIKPKMIKSINCDMNMCIGELCKLAERIVILNSSRCDTELYQHAYLTSDDVLKGIQSRLNVQQILQLNNFKKPVFNFNTIKGLSNVKQRLTEIFVWPIKYPKFFQKCGIPCGTRAILYGPSGCGKTMLMRALINECGPAFNVINIRGPELLSKYIGQSEENIRATFDRARAAKPCIIAFDEFDSLAPTRGHDNTGVTDRVVNQLLTELDGVENSGDGVYVIASTNRLSLIDPALLRPGRFGHKIHVNLPDKNDQIEILRHYTTGVTLGNDINISDIIKRLKHGWTGAELKALVTNAKYLALREINANNVTNSTVEKFAATNFNPDSFVQFNAELKICLRLKHFVEIINLSANKFELDDLIKKNKKKRITQA